MKFGLNDSNIQAIRSVFSQYDSIEQALIYGSRAKGNYRNGSDIDITLMGEGLDLSTLMKLEDQLDDLMLPYKIDLSLYHQIENHDLKEHIKRVGRCFYSKQ